MTHTGLFQSPATIISKVVQKKTWKNVREVAMKHRKAMKKI